MKQAIIATFIALLLQAGVLAEPLSGDVDLRVIHVGIAEPVDPGFGSSVCKYLSQTYGIDVSARKGMASIEQPARTLTVLDAGNKAPSLVWKNPRLCELNIAALGSEKEIGEEAYRWRVLKEAVRAVGGLMAMPECPMWQCALSKHKTLKQLDEKGRGLCPPCMVRAAKHVHMLKLKRAEPEKKPAEKATPGTSKEGSGE